MNWNNPKWPDGKLQYKLVQMNIVNSVCAGAGKNKSLQDKGTLTLQ